MRALGQQRSVLYPLSGWYLTNDMHGSVHVMRLHGSGPSSRDYCSANQGATRQCNTRRSAFGGGRCLEGFEILNVVSLRQAILWRSALGALRIIVQDRPLLALRATFNIASPAGETKLDGDQLA